MHLIFGHDRALADWASSRIAVMGGDKFGLCSAVGVASGDKPSDKLHAVVVYDEYHERHKTCQVSLVATSAKWAQRGIIRSLLSIPFEQYGVNKLYSLMDIGNQRAIKFVLGIGFKQEAVLRDHFGPKKDGTSHHGVVCSMMASEYRRIYGDGKVLKFGSVKKKPLATE